MIIIHQIQNDKIWPWPGYICTWMEIGTLFALIIITIKRLLVTIKL